MASEFNEGLNRIRRSLTLDHETGVAMGLKLKYDSVEE